MTSGRISPFPEFHTKRLVLRRLVEGDLPEIFVLRSDESVNRYLDRNKAKNEEDARNFITAINNNIDQANTYYWAISFKENHQLLGTICLFSFSGDNSEAEIGFEILPAFQGKGIMNEAIREIVRFSFEELQLKRILAFTHPENLRSIHLLEKNQFSLRLNFTGQHDSMMLPFSLTSPGTFSTGG